MQIKSNYIDHGFNVVNLYYMLTIAYRFFFLNQGKIHFVVFQLSKMITYKAKPAYIYLINISNLFFF